MELLKYFGKVLGESKIVEGSSRKAIHLTRKSVDKKLGVQGYSLTAPANRLIVRIGGEVGLFYAVQTSKQLVQKQGSEIFIEGMEITDWPDTKIRAAHYDTKYHQDTHEFVESFIRDLSKYKVNKLIWEWEDKFAYPSHPDIGAPRAFTMLLIIMLLFMHPLQHFCY